MRGKFPAVQWSDQVGEAQWIADRLHNGGRGPCNIIPGGFEAYAAWGGMELHAYTDFVSAALPQYKPAASLPWDGSAPDIGTVDPGDASSLIDVLKDFTRTPDHCWFCLWDGFGWDRTVMFGPDGRAELPDPVPETVRNGPRVRLPGRNYLFYEGKIWEALAFIPAEHQTPNLWWPQDRSWCVASEIDLASTFVGGSAAMIHRLCADSRVEAYEISCGDRWPPKPLWLKDLVREAAQDLMISGTAALNLSRGRITAFLDPARSWISYSIIQDSGEIRDGGGSRIGGKAWKELVDELEWSLYSAVVALVGEG
jgi:hypothetical protein